ncbi:Fur family transcriptional regulator [Wansuia hejianensis]|uniref:Fur family transcriptional regulator n=1 Tax=Wansuia hejianensis TaxID=2763667 RepID=UPI0020164F58
MDINLEQYKNILKSEGYKLTSQRKAILETMFEHHNEHLSCEDIFSLVSKENLDIGIATIYRSLQLFEKLNIVYKLNFDDGFSRYELNFGTEEHHHHHLICLKCGKVLEVKLDLLESLEKEIEKDGNFKIEDHNVKFYGYCKECQ